MTTDSSWKCPNCRKSNCTLPGVYEATDARVVCIHCGWGGWKANVEFFDVVEKPDDDTKAVLRECLETMKANPPAKRKKGERLHTMYQDDDGNTVVGDDW